MSKSRTFTDYLIEDRPAFLGAVQMGMKQGLIVVDEETDAVGVSNRLLLTSTVLQETLNDLVGEWMDSESDSGAFFKALLNENEEGIPKGDEDE
ncbi:MAG: hypothetical protein VYA34_04820 [Myxococcota bacterium]|nr:hypothetical protein [Myxococcota bacterium]